ncbi:MAG: pyridoxamine 5'-phosphate oxidase family protein [Actinomycetota bacterium]|nr:pyridoxamine 5'-phosphate oxidase family protein [Actinomycetota bacterium]
MTEDQAYEDLTAYRLDDDDETKLLTLQDECTFMWATKEGWPVGVIMSFLWRDGHFWLTAAEHRARIHAVRRDPRVSVCVTSKGTKLGALKTVTYKGTCAVRDDDETKTWFYPALANHLIPGDADFAAHFARFLDSPGRVILEVTPTKRIDYDGVKMVGASMNWVAESQPTPEP